MTGRAEVSIGGTKADLMELAVLHAEVRQALSGGVPQLVIASSNLDHVWWFGRGATLPDPTICSTHVVWRVTLDGYPVVRAAQILTGRRWPQLAGSDLLPGILRVAREEEARVGFLGGFPSQHARIADALRRVAPDLQVAGYWGPTRDELTDPARSTALAREIAKAGVDLLVVGLGKPRQELWLQDHLEETSVPVALAFGAAADFLAGTATRAPDSWRRVGFEWLYRLIREPRRLWRRYLIRGPVALWRVLRWSGRLDA